MSDSFVDHLPSHEQRRLKRMMSAAAYEKLRERVKGPEDLEKEMQRNDRMAEAKFALESEPKMHETLRNQMEQDIKQQGMEKVLDAKDLSTDTKKALEQGKFRLTVSSHPQTHQDHLMAVPEGTVQEQIPVKVTYSEKYVAQLQQAQKKT